MSNAKELQIFLSEHLGKAMQQAFQSSIRGWLTLQESLQYADNALQLILQGQPVEHLDQSAYKLEGALLHRVLQQWRDVCSH